MALSAFITKPSDALMFCVLLGCCLFFLWVLFRGSHLSEDEEDATTEEPEEGTDESGNARDIQAVSLDPGCFFVAKGYVVTVLLIALGMALVAAFQTLHPGQ